MSPTLIAQYAGATALALPLVALAGLGAALLVTRDLPETRVHQLVGVALSAALALVGLVGLALVWAPGHAVGLDLGTALALRGYHLDLAFTFDAPALVYWTLDLLLCGLVGLFSSRYLHQESGFYRFYFLLLLFVVGVSLVATAAGLDLLFAGWELVGLCSTLLIAFFHHRVAPVENALRALAVYRFTDVGLLLGVLLLHGAAGSARLGAVDPSGWVPGLTAVLAAALAFGAMGKGALVPFTGWLPRAMEGPTPSSAIFYGALSVHASPFLLLRVAPILEAAPAVRAAVVGIGLLTAAHATMVGRTQTDVKSILAYASATQVGLMWVEIGLGWHTLALVHLAGHAVLRTWQLLRAPSVLHDRHQLANALGKAPARTGRHWEALLPGPVQRWGYRVAMERWFLDEAADRLVAALFALPRALDRADRWWARRLDGAAGADQPGELPTPSEASSR